jgi:hypothetical protein
MSLADLDVARWWGLDDAAARRLAAQIAAATGFELVTVRPHRFADRWSGRIAGRIALYRRDGVRFALVPGGEVVVGYDGARFVPDPAQAADYAEAAPLTGTGLPPDIRRFVDDMTSPRRTVCLPALLVAVDAIEPGIRAADLDDPRVLEQLAYLRAHWEHHRPPGVISQYDWGRVEVKVDDRCQAISARLVEYTTHDHVVADLAGRGLRLPTPEEWEHACGAGAATLFRWGDACPAQDHPLDGGEGPHRLPNAFGLAIGQDPYHAEETADPTVACGGDGGRAICGGYGYFLSWLPLATAYRDRLYDAPADYEEPFGDEDDLLGMMFVRPALQFG